MDSIYNLHDNPIYESEIRAMQDSDPASATKILNPLVETILNNTHAVKKNVEVLAQKTKWIEYNSLADLHLTDDDIATSETLATIVEAMPDYSRLFLEISGGASWHSLFPLELGITTYGMLEINRFTSTRCYLYFYKSAVLAQFDYRYYCQYRPDYGITGFIKKISPWRRIAAAEDIKTQYRRLADLGLADTDIVSLEIIIKKMINFSTLTMSVGEATKWNSLLPYHVGILKIYRDEGENRVFLDFFPSSVDGDTARRWFAIYRLDRGMSEWWQTASVNYEQKMTSLMARIEATEQQNTVLELTLAEQYEENLALKTQLENIQLILARLDKGGI